jgi:hypothetical protein
MKQWIAVIAACLNEQDFYVRILGEPCCQNAARRPATNNDIVKLARGHQSTIPTLIALANYEPFGYLYIKNLLMREVP